ncbi:MAG: LysR family transcriptional regulator [Desulfobacteraceae bacterium]|jgi:LysR family cys regulon transcriptional activator|nr:LysR family transcriptional regulator [Desulfobacteraceae bacterium]
MELIQLVSFYQIAKTGSFSKASQNIYRTQSAVSHQIRNLEEELGVKLFDRIGKKIKLTDEGRILFDVLGPFFDKLDNVKRIYDDMKQCKSGSLTIVSSSAMITYILPNVIKKFINQFPQVKFKLMTCAITSEIPRMILDGETDFGIGPKMDDISSDKLNFLSWKMFDKVILMSKDHPLSKKNKITLADIGKHPLILYTEGTVIRKSVEEAFIRNNLHYEIVMEMDVAENIKKYVEMGVGLSVLSSLAISRQDKNRLFIVNINHLLGKTEYGIYFRKGKYITAIMKQFVKFFAPELLDIFHQANDHD